MDFLRDTAWLKKAVIIEGFTHYYIEEMDVVSSTIIEELTVLFPKMSLAKEASLANLLFVKKAELSETLGEEGFVIEKEGLVNYSITAATTSGLLYGFFTLHEQLVVADGSINYPYQSIPDQKLRMINQWDNADGSVERGYAGQSIFYTAGDFRRDYQLIKEYARLLASVGINGIAINNVNVHQFETTFILPENLAEVEKIAAVFRGYGIKTFLSINYAAPVEVGTLLTADPLDSGVKKWWAQAAADIYQVIPDFGGFVVKADSENRPGPFTYNRNHDEGANVLGDALAPFNGLVIWRCFVYDCAQDWRDRSIDRARAAYDNFKPLDGNFRENVILQIKNGPIDFQVREAVSPLFGGLERTNQILEFQIAQEYTGQQKHICYLLPMWKEILDFETYSSGTQTTVKDVIKNQSPQPSYSGIAAVSNIGFDDNWTGHKLAQANLYGFGKLIWNNQLSSEEVAETWIKLSFELQPTATAALLTMLMTSRKTYEDYTAPLGVCFMVEPNHHYGPNIDGYEYSKWGTYHFADRDGIGVDRTIKTGTGYSGQYLGANVERYESLATCPDNLLLFFHHVPYTHTLQSGKTVIQHIYDTHFAGYESALTYRDTWSKLQGEVDQESFTNVAERLNEQVRCAKEWCDQINTYFYRKSGIQDSDGRKIY